MLQEVGNKITLEKKIKATKNSYETIKRILFDNSINLEGKRIAELGSGWVPILSYLLIINEKDGCVDTYDINEHYNLNEIKKLNDYYKGQHNFEIEDKIKYPLLKGISYFSKTNICDGNLKGVDFVLSRFVLEHISPEKIIEIHNFLFSNLKPGSYVLHLISPSDNRAYGDSLLLLQDFLKYSEDEWNKIQTKFDYHNWLRLPQYLELFKNDFEIVFYEHDQINAKSQNYRKFKELKIHDDFKKFTDQELKPGSINVLLKKK